MDSVTWIQKGILFFIGLCSGGVVAAGLFSFIVSIGAMNRVIGKTHTGDKVHLYENCMAAGITLANLVSLYSFSFILNTGCGKAMTHGSFQRKFQFLLMNLSACFRV